jgi:hypothetical protein
MDSAQRAPDLELASIARSYVDRLFPGGRRRAEPELGAADTVLHWNEDFCRRVAAYYQRSPRLVFDARLSRLYDRFKWETMQQYRAIVDAGIRVAPWPHPGQPYRGSAHLREAVRATRTVYVYLTREGHGAEGSPREYHPLRESSGVTVDGVTLAHNDVFRAVHDIFGHVMYGNTFSAKGEFKATFCHMRMYSDDVHPVLFTEQVAQICWYYFGPHLDRGGPRRYPDQKVFEFPRHFLDEFRAMCAEPVAGR